MNLRLFVCRSEEEAELLELLEESSALVKTSVRFAFSPNSGDEVLLRISDPVLTVIYGEHRVYVVKIVRRVWLEGQLILVGFIKSLEM